MRYRPYVLFLIFSFVPSLFGQNVTRQQLAKALTLERVGHPDEAIAILQPILDSGSAGNADIGQGWNILGLALKDQSKFVDSQHAFEQALRILKRSPGDAREYAMALDNFGGLLMAMNQPEAAHRVRMKAFDVYAKIGDHAGMAVASSDLAGLALSQRSLRQGKKYLRRAQAEAQRATDLSDDNRAAISSMKGWMASIEGNTAGALDAYQDSLELWNKQHGDEHPFTAWGYVLLGNTKSQGAYPAAGMADVQKGLAILSRTVSSLDSRYLKAEIVYAHLLDRAGAEKESLRIRTEAERGLSDIRRQQCSGYTVSAAAFQ